MKTTPRLLAAAGALLIGIVACEPARPAADLLIVGPVWTGDPGAPEAEAVAVRGDRIVAVGPGDELERLVGPDTRVLDAGVGMVLPGFIDSHVHFLTGGANLASVQLRDAASPEEFARRIADFAARQEPGTWILGGDWDHENWGGELPDRDWIDATTAEHPVFVNRLDGHMALANTLALQAAGIDAAAGEVPGGEIVRRVDGTPTGVLKDNAMSAVYGAIPPPTAEQEDAMLRAAMEHVAALGVTSVHHMGELGDIGIFERARERGELRTRIYACSPLARWQELSDRIARRGTGDEWVRTGCLKGFVDGSLGSHTAAFLEPFTDAPGDRGLLVIDPATLQEQVALADAAGLQVNVHAIGDRAIRTLLDVYADVAQQRGDRDRRFRIEHAQHIHPDDIGRFAHLGVIASMQPYHAIDDGRWAERVIGPERARTTYAFRSLLDAGAIVAFGSDWFVAPPDPIAGIHAAVTRQTLDDAHPGGWVPEERVSLEQALHAWTAAAAYASFEEADKGTIAVGKFADLVLLDRDLRAVAPEGIRNARVRATIVGGEVVFEAPAEAAAGR